MQAQHSAGDTLTVRSKQIEASLPADLAQSSTAAIAYEPIWAIFSGDFPTPNEFAAVHRRVRKCLFGVADAAGAGTCILYGEAVTLDNVHPILALKNVNGVLVGGAPCTTQISTR